VQGRDRGWFVVARGFSPSGCGFLSLRSDDRTDLMLWFAARCGGFPSF